MTRPAVDAHPGQATIDFSPARMVADSVLYEGYLLYPYRRSSPKNRVRWQFGVLAPRRWLEARGPAPDDGVAGSAEWWSSQTECLLEADPSAMVEVRLRYLHLQLRTDGREAGSGGFDEAVPQETGFRASLAEVLAAPRAVPVRASGGDEVSPDGRIRRTREPIDAAFTVVAERVPCRSPLYKLAVRVENHVEGLDAAASRQEALRRSLVSTHLLIGTDTGSFLSLMDPPLWAGAAVQECRNIRSFPVLAGPAGTDRLVLSAPIILCDHPQVAPESPGDLFDATEIDEILSLRTLTLTEAEKAEARATDARAAALLDRVDSMPEEMMARLHGAVRSLRPIGSPRPPAGDRPPAPADATGVEKEVRRSAEAGVVVAGVRLQAGSPVVLRPRSRGADAQDMFLAGRRATVKEILHDVDGSVFLAVTVDGDPRADLAAGPGRVRHFSTDEVIPADPSEGAP